MTDTLILKHRVQGVARRTHHRRFGALWQACAMLALAWVCLAAPITVQAGASIDGLILSPERNRPMQARVVFQDRSAALGVSVEVGSEADYRRYGLSRPAFLENAVVTQKPMNPNGITITSVRPVNSEVFDLLLKTTLDGAHAFTAFKINSSEEGIVDIQRRVLQSSDSLEGSRTDASTAVGAPTAPRVAPPKGPAPSSAGSTITTPPTSKEPTTVAGGESSSALATPQGQGLQVNRLASEALGATWPSGEAAATEPPSGGHASVEPPPTPAASNPETKPQAPWYRSFFGPWSSGTTDPTDPSAMMALTLFVLGLTLLIGSAVYLIVKRIRSRRINGPSGHGAGSNITDIDLASLSRRNETLNSAARPTEPGLRMPPPLQGGNSQSLAPSGPDFSGPAGAYPHSAATHPVYPTAPPYPQPPSTVSWPTSVYPAPPSPASLGWPASGQNPIPYGGHISPMGPYPQAFVPAMPPGSQYPSGQPLYPQHQVPQSIGLPALSQGVLHDPELMILIAANQQAQATRYARANEQYFKALADQALEDKQVFFSHFARGRPGLSPRQSGLSDSAVVAPTPQATMPRADPRERAEPAMAGTASTDAPMNTSPPARPKVRVIPDIPAEASNGKTSPLGVHRAENSAELVANPRAEQPAQPSPRVGRTKVDRQKLDLASVYMTMGDLTTAKILAKEILASPMTDLHAEAQGILQSIEEIESA